MATVLTILRSSENASLMSANVKGYTIVQLNVLLSYTFRKITEESYLEEQSFVF